MSLDAFSSKWSRMYDLLDNDGYIFKTGLAWKYLMWRGKGHQVHSSVGKRYNSFPLDLLQGLELNHWVEIKEQNK